ncbi:MAG: IPT/TIG domain-containing protein [Bryobacterales bacterium]|nr:IPT/TIG domain-containing protein [Bryobacteraceae bacterium]MDW8129767.1 IPT/TIG domain-containing protein [Bryobacterales bacterium]
MTRASLRFLLSTALALLCAATAEGYYHFVRYASRSGPFVAIPEKFDLNALPGRAVTYLISERGPDQLGPNDSFASVISQIRLAASVWSQVPGSELRLVFGGLFTPETPRTTPAIEILFDELPPGVLAMGGPVARAEITPGATGAFVPILRSVVVLRRDLTDRPSYSDGFFLTTLHELGHALGLQHTAASSLMATDVTRAVTRGQPLTQDDIAGICLLYPGSDFRARTGGIAGQVWLSSGEGVSLASVVAINPSGHAVSALTHPDGTYRIEGLPPGLYYVYVHPLPPPELGPYGIVLPVDASGAPFQPTDGFESLFYPGTRNTALAATLAVSAGTVTEGVNFRVARRTPSSLYGVTTYSFPGSVAVKPAFINVNGPTSRWFLVAVSQGMALTTGSAPLPGLGVSLLGGGAAVNELRAYAPDPRYLQIGFTFNPLAGTGPRHLLFSYNNDLYLLPAGLNVVNRTPPSVATVTPQVDASGNRIALLTGSGLTPDTRIFFDGVEARVRSAEDGRMVVVPPPAPGGHRATVLAIGPDGQTSAFLQGRSLPVYEYEPSDPPFVSLSLNSLPAGAEAMIEVTGFNTNFDASTQLGFGTSDVVVRRIWVTSPTRLLANVSVVQGAPGVFTSLTLTTGLRSFTQPFGLAIEPANPRLPVISSQLTDPTTGRASVYPGGLAALSGANLGGAPGAVRVTLDDQPVPVQSVGPNRIVFQIPGAQPVGPAILRVQVGEERSYPVIVTIDPPPPAIVSLLNSSAGNSGRAARPGDLITLTVRGLAEPGTAVAPASVKISVGGMEHQALAVFPATEPGSYMVVFMLAPGVPSGPWVAITVSLEQRVSMPYYMPIQP